MEFQLSHEIRTAKLRSWPWSRSGSSFGT